MLQLGRDNWARINQIGNLDKLAASVATVYCQACNAVLDGSGMKGQSIMYSLTRAKGRPYQYCIMMMS
jgi:hypothetical protein